MSKRVSDIERIRIWFRTADPKSAKTLLEVLAGDIGLRVVEQRAPAAKKAASRKKSSTADGVATGENAKG